MKYKYFKLKSGRYAIHNEKDLFFVDTKEEAIKQKKELNDGISEGDDHE